MTPPRRTDEQIADQLISQLVTNSHPAPCRYAFAIFVVGGVLATLGVGFGGLFTWTANRTLADYDKRLETIAAIGHQNAEAITELHVGVTLMQRDTNDIKTVVDALRPYVGLASDGTGAKVPGSSAFKPSPESKSKQEVP